MTAARTVATRLVGLYPRCLRDRWGDAAMAAEVSSWRSWPNLLVGVVDMWLHPVVWPARSAAERHGRAAVVAFVIGLSGWLFGHAAVEDALLPAALAGSRWLDISDLLMLGGLALVSPMPRPDVRALRRLGGRIVRRVALPVVLGAAAVVVANRGDAVPSALRLPVLAGWWLGLVLGGIAVCRVVAEAGPDVVDAPGPVRLRAGIGVVAAAYVLASVTVVEVLLTTTSSTAPPLVVVAGLLVLVGYSCWTLRDLHSVAAS